MTRPKSTRSAREARIREAFATAEREIADARDRIIDRTWKEFAAANPRGRSGLMIQRFNDLWTSFGGAR